VLEVFPGQNLSLVTRPTLYSHRDGKSHHLVVLTAPRGSSFHDHTRSAQKWFKEKSLFRVGKDDPMYFLCSPLSALIVSVSCYDLSKLLKHAQKE